ncbi:type IV secretion system protein [Salmonella enterica subsp. enterica serovar Newport]|nr:type IV secretion system protein [Salmonella enterica subsp. enterica serovar Newport]
MSGYWRSLDDELTSLIHQAGDGLSQTLSGPVTQLILSGVTIYIIFHAYKTMAGKITTPIEDLVFRLVCIAITLSILANEGGLMSSTQEAITSLKDGLGAGANIWDMLDNLWTLTQKTANQLYDMDTDTVPLKGATGMLLVWVGSVAIMCCSALVALVAEFSLFILAALAPIFLACLAWGWFRSMFSNWLNAIISAFLTVILAGLFVTAASGVLKHVMDVIQSNQNIDILNASFKIIATGIVSSGLILLSPKLASGLAGGAITQAMQSMASHGIGKASRMATPQMSKALKSLQGDASGEGKSTSDASTSARASNAGRYNPVSARKAGISQMQNVVENRRQAANDSLNKTSTSRSNNIYPFR